MIQSERAPAGHWPDYLKAMSADVFECPACKPTLGELPLVICNVLESQTASPFRGTESKISDSSRGEMR